MNKAIIYLIFICVFIIAPNLTFAFEPTYQFTDQEKDFESGLYYFGAREYNPNTGQFLQQDPVLNDVSSDIFF